MNITELHDYISKRPFTINPKIKELDDHIWKLMSEHAQMVHDEACRENEH
jgi:hypothetical protein